MIAASALDTESNETNPKFKYKEDMKKKLNACDNISLIFHWFASYHKDPKKDNNTTQTTFIVSVSVFRPE